MVVHVIYAYTPMRADMHVPMYVCACAFVLTANTFEDGFEEDLLE